MPCRASNCHSVVLRLPNRRRHKIFLNSVLWAVLSCALLLNLGISSTFVYAETVCRSKIYYTWKRTDGEKELATYAVTVVSTGSTPEISKQALDAKLPGYLDKAFRLCVSEHEEESECLKTKFFHSAGVLSTASFSARRKLEESIVKECKSREGVCLGSKNDDAVCLEESAKAPVVEGTEGEAKGEDKKDVKK